MNFIQPIIQTHEEQLTNHIKELVQNNQSVFINLSRGLQLGFDMVWNSQFPPQEVIDALEARGISAVAMFTTSAQLQHIMKSVNPDYEKLTPPVQYTVVDGKIVVQ